METHLIVCKNREALFFLQEEICLLGNASKIGKPVTQGDALVARDALFEAGFEWGVDFYLKKLDY